MTLVPLIGFVVVALVALGFAAWPLRRAPKKGRWILGGALALLLGVGAGTYLMVGQPQLALRAGLGLETREVNGLIPFLITRVRKTPADLTAWTFLGRAYMAAGDPGDAAKAYGRAVTLARLTAKPNAELSSAYGQALVAEGGGAVSDDAMTAFKNTLALDPKDSAARFFMGEGLASRGDAQGALAMWQGLLADTPTNAPLHQTLIDRIALLTSQSVGRSGGTPDIGAMVNGLAARLKQNPKDAAGWQRLIRAYAVMGKRDDAKAALAEARRSFAADADVNKALNAEAQELKLD